MVILMVIFMYNVHECSCVYVVYVDDVHVVCCTCMNASENVKNKIPNLKTFIDKTIPQSNHLITEKNSMDA